jgi:hypothetical protein
MGRKQPCPNPKKHIFTLHSDKGRLLNRALPLSRNRAKQNQRILEPAAEFVTATRPGYRQAASSAMHECILTLRQTGACIHANDGAVLINVALWNISPSLTTDPMCKTFTEFHIQLPAPLTANSAEEALTDHTLTLQVKPKTRELARGFSTRGADE